MPPIKIDLKEIGYIDFGDLDNIIKDKNTGKAYIVDTEIKSFSPPLSKVTEIDQQLAYAYEKTLFLNGENQDYTFKLKYIGFNN